MLILDPRIMHWVLLPIVFVMMLVSVGRAAVQQLMRSDTNLDLKQQKQKQTLQRAQRLRMNGNIIPAASFAMRKRYFTFKGVGLLRQKVKKGAGAGMQNPNQMMGMMKNNMSFMVPNMVMMAWISNFFSGFVLVKVPFPLTLRFKPMLQRGIGMDSLDVSYVSSLSWYFLVMFGMRGFLGLLIGDSNVDSAEQMMQAQMGVGVGMGGQGNFDAAKAFQQERDSLNLKKHEFVVAVAERRLVPE